MSMLYLQNNNQGENGTHCLELSLFLQDQWCCILSVSGSCVTIVACQQIRTINNSVDISGVWLSDQ